MKKTLILLTSLCATLGSALRADDVAVLDIRFEDGTVRQAVIEFYEKDAPQTVANFKKLAGKGFYKGCAFHRAIPTAIVQTGDPLSKKKDRTAVGTGGPGYTLPPEIRHPHTKGAVAAARVVGIAFAAAAAAASLRRRTERVCRRRRRRRAHTH